MTTFISWAPEWADHIRETVCPRCNAEPGIRCTYVKGERNRRGFLPVGKPRLRAHQERVDRTAREWRPNN